MTCPYYNICGGCPLRNLNQQDYQTHKSAAFSHIISLIYQPDIPLGQPIFIDDGNRRRAEFTFSVNKRNILFGFNAAGSHNIADIDKCVALTKELNNILPKVKKFLSEFAQIKISQRRKNKVTTSVINKGEIWLTEAANGIDILLETEDEINVEHRMLICDFVNENSSIIRFSIGKKNAPAETIVEKSAPYIDISGYQIYIASGTFLQASDAAEKKLIELVCQHISDSPHNIADLFCGIGTFSYPLSLNKKNKITAVDVSSALLEGLQKSINKNTINNITILQKNLFKYPLTADELSKFDIIIFDPPRAGAAKQIAEFSKIPAKEKPHKVIAVSCNPRTFVNDANNLLQNGYEIKEITMVDQFVYSEHFELVALFELKGERK